MGIMDGPIGLWSFELGGEYRLGCTVEHNREAESATVVVVVENAAELERRSFPAKPNDPDAWRRPYEYASELHRKCFARAMERMAPIYQGLSYGN